MMMMIMFVVGLDDDVYICTPGLSYVDYWLFASVNSPLWLHLLWYCYHDFVLWILRI